MIRSFGAGAVLAAALALAAAPSAMAAQAQPAAPARLAPGQWPQTRSDVAPDPAIRFGALPNGMRYAIRRQQIPPGQAALRLWFGAGSLMEADDQAGLAHFLEHMAFNGSKQVPEGEMVKILERLGLAFGADTNASTSFSETIYKLDLPRTDAETVDTSLKLLAEAAFDLTIAPAAVDRERGVVLSEERARDTPGYRAYLARMSFLLQGQRLPTRTPIGKVEVLKSAPASRIADFYRAWYRPERAVLVAVGDFDVDAMEAKIRAAFGGWAAQAPALSEPDQGPVAPRAAEARLLVDPGVAEALQISWVAPPDLAPDTRAKRRADRMEDLALAVLNRRFSAIARGNAPPFLAAAAYKGEVEDSAQIATVDVRAAPGRWQAALASAEQEARRLANYGVTQAELDREIEEVRASMRADAAGEATRRPADLAGEIVQSLADDTVVTSPAQDLAAFEADVKGLTAAEVNATLPALFRGQGPLVFMASPKPVEGGEAAVLAALEASTRVAVLPPAKAREVTWPYADFGAPGAVAERREVADLGVTFVRFANGVRLIVKPTAFRKDEALVRVNVGQGMVGLPSDRQSPLWAGNALIEGGLKKIDAEDMERALAAKVYGARFSVADDAYVLSGGARTGDLATQLQVLAAYMTEPGWREAAFDRLKTTGAALQDQLDSTDSGVFQRDLQGLIHSGDRRWTFPSRRDIAGTTLADVRAAVDHDLASGPVEVVIVGDVTVDQAIAATAATFGALPPRPAPQIAPAAARAVAYPRGNGSPVVLTHKGRADQAIGYIGWGTSDYWTDPQRAHDVAILREIMELRLTDELREAQGVTYSPNVNSQHSLVWTGWGYIAATVEAPPDKMPVFFAETKKIAQDLRDHEVGPDELERAKQPRIEGIQKDEQTNGFWLGQLSRASADPRRLDVIRDFLPGAKRVTAADVRRAAQTLLLPERAYELVVEPPSTAADAGQAAARAPS